MNNNYAQNIAKEKDSLLSMLPFVSEHERARGVRRIREIVVEEELLEKGEHWTQQESDTKARIVLRDLQISPKTIRS